MDHKQLFHQYYGKLAWEGWLKAFLWGFDVGCIVCAILAFIGWAVNSAVMFWVAIGFGIAVAVVVTVVLYFRLFRPTTTAIARRLDSLGLEERMITMAELQKSEEFLAMRQREDAQQKLASLPSKALKVRPFSGTGVGGSVSALSVSATVCSPLLAVSMSVIFGLGLAGILPTGDQVFHRERPKEYVDVHYLAEDGGTIEGASEQTVEVGGTTETVLAVQEDGYVFVQWSDGVETPSRSDIDVQEELVVFAEFMEIGDMEEDDDTGDRPDDVPPTSGDNGEIDPDQPEKPNPDDPPDPSDPSDNGEVINGKTDYKDVYPGYYEWIIEQIASGELELTDELRNFLEDYYNSLA